MQKIDVIFLQVLRLLFNVNFNFHCISLFDFYIVINLSQTILYKNPWLVKIIEFLIFLIDKCVSRGNSGSYNTKAPNLTFKDGRVLFIQFLQRKVRNNTSKLQTTETEIDVFTCWVGMALKVFFSFLHFFFAYITNRC